nr:helix-turn-helix domain-containing protein [Clostridioides difficile]
MTKNELAKLVGVRRETIVHLENGKYNLLKHIDL